MSFRDVISGLSEGQLQTDHSAFSIVFFSGRKILHTSHNEDKSKSFNLPAVLK